MAMKKASSDPFWWYGLREEDPITLEPLSSLPYPPFLLGNNYFDGLALASYMVSRSIFQNPLSREPLQWTDCHRLDQYLEQYTPTTKLNVCQAFGFYESLRIKTTNVPNDVGAEARRVGAIRSEAAAALRGLFVFQRSSHHPNNESSSVEHHDLAGRQSRIHPPPGFNLQAGVQQVQGLSIVDDDLAVGVAADQTAREEVQAAFPPLSVASGENDDTNESNHDRHGV
eukprot:scaffold13078_cov48-Attheya_sp.AAC.1